LIEIFCIIFESIFFNKTVSEGRPEADVIIMLKILVLPLLHGLFDFELWKQGIHRISFRKFLGLLSTYQTASQSVYSEKGSLIAAKKKK